MAFRDWNHDGKKDWKDNYIEYNIYKNTMGKNNSSSGYSSSGDGTSTLGAIIGVVVVFLVLGGIISLFTPKCIVDGCSSEKEKGSNYCYYHENSEIYKINVKNSVKSRYTHNSYNYGTTANSGSTSNSNESYDYKSYKSEPEKTYSSSNKNTTGVSNYSGSYDSYDEGYEDVYDNEDYDYDRYQTDSDYANGVEDAMEEYYEEYGEEW